MPVVKGGVWTNIEDEILKASVSKYGLNQWARVSSLLARKTPKQCKARWSEWLDPGIRKIEWSKDEDEKLLHLAKLMPTQWRTIAPIVGRTATQCLERYQKLLDEAEARENDDLGLGGPEGGETAPPSADDVRRLRPGELDPDPESKPARPDTIDLDEDEKEMLSEARARLANTQGKKAKRKARERQLEESRRLAVLQKRRELKNAGINIKVVTRKPGQMDYNADIPFEKAPAPGFYDTAEEETRNDRQKEMFDPRKQQLANKRKGVGENDIDDRKRRKGEKSVPTAAFAAAAKAGQMQKIREAERSSKRRSLVLPSPQVGESELEDIVKMGMAGEKATRIASVSENEATRGLIGNYSGIVGGTPIRTPRPPQEEDRVANEIRNARARTDTQSALLGGDNVPLYEGKGTTGYDGIAPSKLQSSTPNPMATPFRQPGASGSASISFSSSHGPGATPLRTPRDSLRMNDETPGSLQLIGHTPQEVRRQELSAKNSLRNKLASLPKPKETEWELELPEEHPEIDVSSSLEEEDAAIRDQRNSTLREAAEQAEFKRQTQVIQRSLPRLPIIDLEALLARARSKSIPAERLILSESAQLMANDARKYGGSKIQGLTSDLQSFRDDELDRGRTEIALELEEGSTSTKNSAERLLYASIELVSRVPGLDNYEGDDDLGTLTQSFNIVSSELSSLASMSGATEKKLAVVLGGYQARAKKIRQKTSEAAYALDATKRALSTKQDILVLEEASVASRLEGLRGEVEAVMRRERNAQQLWKDRMDELAEL